MCHGGDVVFVCTEFHSNYYVLPLACYSDKEFYQETLPEAIFLLFTNMFVVDFHFVD